MPYSIEFWDHSADKDHRKMKGWTLLVDKTIDDDTWVTFHTYSMAFYTEGEFDIDFHKGVHAAEHMIAYKKDTWSVRDSLTEVTHGKIDWKVILDISPYKTWANTFGFRITSMIPLEVETVRELTKISVQRAISFLESWEIEDPEDFQWIPFARPISCGQYDFHDKEKAIKDLKSVDIDNLEIAADTKEAEHTTAYVCDLRFLKPKIEWGDDMIMFSPDFSYRISELIEKRLPEILPWSITIVGTFWCMTWMYLCISSALWDKSDIPTIHKAIIDLIRSDIHSLALDGKERLQLETLLENYENFWVK